LLLPFRLLTHLRPTGIYSLSLHDALPIFGTERYAVGFLILVQKFGLHAGHVHVGRAFGGTAFTGNAQVHSRFDLLMIKGVGFVRSEEHTSELQSRENLVCRLLLEKKKK